MAANVDTPREVKGLMDAGLAETQVEAMVGTVIAGRVGPATTADLDLLRADWQAELKRLETGSNQVVGRNNGCRGRYSGGGVESDSGSLKASR